MARIYLITLYLRGACSPQRRLFRKTFGLSVEVNKENVKTAMKVGLAVCDAAYFGILRRTERVAMRVPINKLFVQARSELVAEGYDYSWRSGRWEKL